jgi:hypothetical protein
MRISLKGLGDSRYLGIGAEPAHQSGIRCPSHGRPPVRTCVARGLTDPDTFVVIEVFENRQALERQKWTVWETSAAE